MHRFKSDHGSCLCRQLLKGCYLSTEDGQILFKKKDYLNHVCLNCVQSIVAILEQID